MERSYQGCAGFLFLIGLSQEARSYYSTQRFEVVQAGAKRQVGLVISFVKAPYKYSVDHEYHLHNNYVIYQIL